MSTKEAKTTNEPEKPQIFKRFACLCGKLAIWCYIPASRGDYPYFCDDCVSRGCSCNEEYDDPEFAPIAETIQFFNESGVLWRWKEKDKVIEHIDEKGRLIPCVEYFYSKDGWKAEQDEVDHYIKNSTNHVLI